MGGGDERVRVLRVQYREHAGKSALSSAVPDQGDLPVFLRDAMDWCFVLILDAEPADIASLDLSELGAYGELERI